MKQQTHYTDVFFNPTTGRYSMTCSCGEYRWDGWPAYDGATLYAQMHRDKFKPKRRKHETQA